MGASTLRVCIVAEHASTRFGGEAILPYHYFRVLRARGVEAWLVVHSRTREELDGLFPNDRDRIAYLEDLAIHKLLFRVSLLLPRRVAEATVGLASQLLTQFCERKIVRRLVKEQRVNVVHQPIPVSPRYPSLMSKLGAPLVIGPMNGGMNYPAAFRHGESSLTRLFVSCGRSLTNIANQLLPGKRDAAVALVANQRTRDALPSGVRGRIIEMAENGVDLAQWDNTGEQPSPTNRFLFLGRLIDLKQVNLAIEALLLAPGAVLDVIGDGPMLDSWTEFAGRLGVSDRVRFLGWIPQKDCAQHLRSATALLLPSVCECGGAVVLEAMAMGKPVIAARWGGPADYLDATCGFLIDPDSPQAMIDGFAAAMRLLMDSPRLCQQLGAAGREKVLRDLDWEKKIDQMLLIYESVLPQR